MNELHGFDPLTAYADETREALGALLRPREPGANTAAQAACPKTPVTSSRRLRTPSLSKTALRWSLTV